MSIGLVGRKCGMSRVFTEDGRSVPVTLIEATPNRVTQVKTVETDGYNAVQVSAGSEARCADQQAARGSLREGQGRSGSRPVGVPRRSRRAGKFAVGGEVKADEVFTVGQKVDVAGITKGKGFQGTIKRINFTMGDATHGNSLSHRSPGSIGQRQTPGRVFPGKKMAGHMGNVRRSADESRSRQDRHRSSSDRDQGFGSGRSGRRRDHPSRREGEEVRRDAMELNVIGAKPVTVSDAVFGKEFREDLVHQVVVAYRNAGRAGTKAQKTRSDMSRHDQEIQEAEGRRRASRRLNALRSSSAVA